MPKSLFYGGVVSCALVAIMLVAHAGGQWTVDSSLAQILSGGPLFGTNSFAPIWLMILSVPVAAMFLRMCSLLAARSLFAGLMGIFAVASSGLAAVYVASVQFRMTLLLRNAASLSRERLAEALRPLADQQLTGYVVLGWFLSVTFLSMRPYFKMHSNPFFAALVYFPAPLFLLTVAEEMSVLTGTTASVIFWLILAILFIGIALHGLRHRHLFIEVTNLRELLDSRIDPAHRGMAIGRGMAFDS